MYIIRTKKVFSVLEIKANLHAKTRFEVEKERDGRRL